MIVYILNYSPVAVYKNIKKILQESEVLNSGNQQAS